MDQRLSAIFVGDSWGRIYSILTDDAVERGIMREEFYFLSDEQLAFIKRMQGYDPATCFPGARYRARLHDIS